MLLLICFSCLIAFIVFLLFDLISKRSLFYKERKNTLIDSKNDKQNAKLVSNKILKKDTTILTADKQINEINQSTDLNKKNYSKTEITSSLSTPSVLSSNEKSSSGKLQKSLSMDELNHLKIADQMEIPATFIMSALKPVPIYSFKPPSSRRKTLPALQIELKSIPYVAIIKGKLPLWAYEPIGVLQELCEELNFASILLDKALNNENPTMRMCYIAAFIISGYASISSKKQKPFSPLRGETFEYISEDGWQYHSEQISHTPPISAAFAQHKDWEWHNCTKGKTNLKTSGCIELDYIFPTTLALHKYKEIYTWCKVKTQIINPLQASCKRLIRHEGLMTIRSTNGIKCSLKFINNENNDVIGSVYENGKVVHQLTGQWDKNLNRVLENNKLETLFKVPEISEKISHLFYGFNLFTVTLNELNSEDSKFLPPTDSRFRPDQRYLEKGDIQKGSKAKFLLEKSEKKREEKLKNYKPLWFEPVAPIQETKSELSKRFKELWRTNGLYWKSRKENFKNTASSQMIKDLFTINNL